MNQTPDNGTTEPTKKPERFNTVYLVTSMNKSRRQAQIALIAAVALLGMAALIYFLM